MKRLSKDEVIALRDPKEAQQLVQQILTQAAGAGGGDNGAA